LRLADIVFALALVWASGGRAFAQEATHASGGPRVALSSGLFVPPEGGTLGFAITGDASYGFALGKATLAPGLRLAGYFRSGLAVAAPLASARVALTLGVVRPYVLAGIGPGHASDRQQLGLAYQAAAGVTLDLGARWSLGAEASYLAISGTDFRALSLGPCVAVRL
jgi:hypothetical protein